MFACVCDVMGWALGLLRRSWKVPADLETAVTGTLAWRWWDPSLSAEWGKGREPTGKQTSDFSSDCKQGSHKGEGKVAHVRERQKSTCPLSRVDS